MPRASFRTYVLLGVLVWLACFPVVWRDFSPSAPAQYDFRALLFPSDLAVVAVIALAVWRRRLPLMAAVAGVVLVTLGAAFLAHPSARGEFQLLRWAGVVAVAALADRRAATVVAGGWACLESVVALAQKVHGGPLGLPSYAENPSTFVKFGHAVAPPGTLVHPYLLAGLALVGGTLLALEARRNKWLLLPAAVAIAPVGFTYSRTALLALAAVLVCLAIGRARVAVLVLALAVALPAVAWHDGWVNRSDVGSNTTGNGLDTGRGTLIRQSLDVIKAHPVTGVGPGNYVRSLRDAGVSTTETGGYLKPVHNLPLLAAAEGGVLAGLAMLALFAVGGVVAWRGGAASVAVFCAFVPFCLLDHFGYTFPQGLVLIGLWLAALTTATPRPGARRHTSA